jgi:hypothetical protein
VCKLIFLTWHIADMPMVNSLKLFMSGVLLGSLLPWYIGIIMVAVFMFVDSKDLDLGHCAGLAISWAESKCPVLIIHIISAAKKGLQKKTPLPSEPPQGGFDMFDFPPDQSVQQRV